MRALFADLQRIAPTDATLLIVGESGTGKDAVAESVHRAGGRAQRPFVAFECATRPASPLEAELFGQLPSDRGASAARGGAFERASGGTLYLNNVDQLPLDLQRKLLEVLESSRIERTEDNGTMPMRVRVIAATTRSLGAEVNSGAFREDLYGHLAAVQLVLPPLRERMEDLELLVEHFLSLENPPRTSSEIPEEMWQFLHAHRWPGNIRELRAVVRRFARLGGQLFVAEGSSETRIQSAPVQPLRVARRVANDAFERAYLESLLQQTRGNVTRAAALAQISRQALQRLKRKHVPARTAAKESRLERGQPQSFIRPKKV